MFCKRVSVFSSFWWCARFSDDGRRKRCNEFRPVCGAVSI